MHGRIYRSDFQELVIYLGEVIPDLGRIIPSSNASEEGCLGIFDNRFKSLKIRTAFIEYFLLALYLFVRRSIKDL